MIIRLGMETDKWASHGQLNFTGLTAHPSSISMSIYYTDNLPSDPDNIPLRHGIFLALDGPDSKVFLIRVAPGHFVVESGPVGFALALP